MENILKIAQENQKRAYEVLEQTDVISIWESVGAEVNLVGSLRTGLLMTHRDIDLHIYSSPLKISESFAAMAKLAENPSVVRIEYANGIDTEEQCIEWHAWCKDKDGELWQIDMIHILKGSKYDGYFEKVADRINAIITQEQRETILKLKYETPASEKIIGVEYYMAVIGDGVHNFSDFREWRKGFSIEKGMNWMP